MARACLLALAAVPLVLGAAEYDTDLDKIFEAFSAGGREWNRLLQARQMMTQSFSYEYSYTTSYVYDDDCVDSDFGANDKYGDGCFEYMEFPTWCGNFDDSDFTPAARISNGDLAIHK